MTPPLVLPGGHHVLVVLHGHGDDPTALAHRRDELDPDHRATVVLPAGPLPLPDGGAAWFGEDATAADGDAMVRAIDSAIAEGAARASTDPSPTIRLVGYSQGAAAALAYAVRPGAPELAGVAAAAGWLPTIEDLTWAPRPGLRVLMVHSSDDEVVPLPMGRSTARYLAREGAAVTWEEQAGDHRLTGAMTSRIAAWLMDLPTG